MSEQTAENDACLVHHGSTPIAVLHRAGALSPAFTAVHATHLRADDVRRLSASGATVCMCPTTERDLGDGIGPSVELAEAEVPIHLGSDSNAVIDHFAEARAVELHERFGTTGVERLEKMLREQVQIRTHTIALNLRVKDTIAAKRKPARADVDRGRQLGEGEAGIAAEAEKLIEMKII